MTEEQVPVEEQEELLFEEYDPRVREDVDGLIWLGHLEDDFEFCGHRFVLRTLRGDEELSAGLVVKEYVETWGQARAWAWAKVALSLVSIDGDETFCPPMGPDKQAFARARFNYVTSRWFWPVGEFLYQHYVTLEERQLEAIRAVQNLSTRTLPTSTPFADSSIEPGDSADNPPVTPTSTPSNTDS